MRAYRLHSTSWSRIVSYRVSPPGALRDRLLSRRRPARSVPQDGRLVLLSCNHAVDPRTNAVVDRRELLDRIIEALSVDEIDGVVATADLIEELTLLNVLEHRLAFCSATGEPYTSSVVHEASTTGGVSSSAIVTSRFDGASITQRWDSDGPKWQPWSLAADVAELTAKGLPTILELGISHADGRTDFDTSWNEWIEPIQRTVGSLTTGAGVWLSLPAIQGVAHLAEATGVPILLRDTEVPLHPTAWASFFDVDWPVTVRGMLPGASALFPLEGTVAEATATIAGSVRKSHAAQHAA